MGIICLTLFLMKKTLEKPIIVSLMITFWYFSKKVILSLTVSAMYDVFRANPFTSVYQMLLKYTIYRIIGIILICFKSKTSFF